jgi:hypothetical protein
MLLEGVSEEKKNDLMRVAEVLGGGGGGTKER